ncbi:hypothetical protein PMAYCL1PPCAC_19369 [Pristionchus mayeri]|uniref:C2H2-type domain-containing protein n=1 Tax=Pristionchus mayeri TaxID=1317129 RepID=A0AAN5CRA6_9BILA|nr:hypothetical protein PMAYCL1PPCAC_19369 [Pristionchus mayeri]
MSLASRPRSIFARIDDLLASGPIDLSMPSCSRLPASGPGAMITIPPIVSPTEQAERCPTCGKEYRTAGALKMHQRTHAPPCVCQKCGKAFSRPWLLKGHLRTHTGERPYECAECGRRFADRSNLRAHEHTHRTERRHKCSKCALTFARSHVLLKHEELCGSQDDLPDRSNEDTVDNR